MDTGAQSCARDESGHEEEGDYLGWSCGVLCVRNKPRQGVNSGRSFCGEELKRNPDVDAWESSSKTAREDANVWDVQVACGGLSYRAILPPTSKLLQSHEPAQRAAVKQEEKRSDTRNPQKLWTRAFALRNGHLPVPLSFSDADAWSVQGFKGVQKRVKQQNFSKVPHCKCGSTA
ncbi:UNVERIFIED_CONTAM: hypothetical protein HHA_452130 [Hammondia hammondi]|eukprot:XP_008885173.1 hypothetical protein HHA_452130 [Hammondia hammondi]